MNHLLKSLNNVSTREDLSNFIDRLSNDLNSNKGEWENHDLPSFLEAMSGWVQDMDGFYKNNGKDVPIDVPWNIFADILYAAKVYE
jgi:hypothetical protein